uniref:Uncharacterized protein n=1 Tax=Ditylenchus dipsaci TaxID=166011 RepID=A0A915DW96_9BILA
MGSEPPTIDNEKHFDGGWSDNMPVFENVPTITVSPFLGPVTIGLDHKGKPGFQQHFDNLIRGKTALIPQQEELNRYFEDGFKDGIKFLEKHGFNDEHESMQHLEIPDHLK